MHCIISHIYMLTKGLDDRSKGFRYCSFDTFYVYTDGGKLIQRHYVCSFSFFLFPKKAWRKPWAVQFATVKTECSQAVFKFFVQIQPMTSPIKLSL